MSCGSPCAPPALSSRFRLVAFPARQGSRHYNGADSLDAKELPCLLARWSIATPTPRFRTAMPPLRKTFAPPRRLAVGSWSRPTTSPCPPAWMPTAKCRLLRATCRHIVWLLRMLASLPRRLRRSSALSMALNAIGTRAASLWLSAGPRAPSYSWAACIGLATQAILRQVLRARRGRRTSLVLIHPIPFAVGSTMTPTCMFGKT